MRKTRKKAGGGGQGRPSGRKPLVSLRMAPPLLEKLKAASEANGLTTSEEIVNRLAQSFTAWQEMREKLYGPEKERLVRFALASLGAA